jgi:hypothetical protein
MKIIILIVLTFLVLVTFIFLRYRIVYAEKIRGVSELKYKMIEIGQNDFFRYSFESIFKNKRVHLKHKLENIEWMYIAGKDLNKLCPESPQKMKDANYSIKFKFETQQLFFGGYGLAKIISFEKIKGKPEVLKS